MADEKDNIKKEGAAVSLDRSLVEGTASKDQKPFDSGSVKKQEFLLLTKKTSLDLQTQNMKPMEVNMSDGPLEMDPKKNQAKVEEKDEEDDEAEEDCDEDYRRNDHNRWYCNICKDGGELLCCDRCPRAFHMHCLGITEDDLPDADWYCRLCSVFLSRKKAREDAKQEKRNKREENKRKRDEVKKTTLKENEENRKKRDLERIQKKARKAVELQKKNSVKKVEYKDKAEEKLGKIAEKILQGKMGVKLDKLTEVVEKLEKEERDKKKKEEILMKRRKRYPMEDKDLEPLDDENKLPSRPLPKSPVLSGIPPDLMGELLSIWDFFHVFQSTTKTSSMALEDLRLALLYTEHTPLISEMHMSLLELILMDRANEDYASDEEDDIDGSDRWQYELRHAPLTIGTPTTSLLTFQTWPSVLGFLIASVPRYTSSASPLLREAVEALSHVEYPLLCVSQKIALLSFLVGRAYATQEIRTLLRRNLEERLECEKVFAKEELNEKREIQEQEKTLKDSQKAKKLAELQRQRSAYEKWIAGGKEGPSPQFDAKDPRMSPTSSMMTEDKDDNETESDVSTSEESDNEEKFEGLSRQEILIVKRKKEEQRALKRKVKEERERRKKWEQTLKRKQDNVKDEIRQCIDERNLQGLMNAISKGKEAGLETGRGGRIWRCKEMEEAYDNIKRLEIYEARREESEKRREKYTQDMAKYFIRTSIAGVDRDHQRYWVFASDNKRIFVERFDVKKVHLQSEEKKPLNDDFSPENIVASWFCYESPEDIQQLLASFDTRGVRESKLKQELESRLCPKVLTASVKAPRASPKSSHLENEEKSSSKEVAEGKATGDFLTWTNGWRKKERGQDVVTYHISMNNLTCMLIRLEEWLSARFKDQGLDTNWKEVVNAATTVESFMEPLFMFERAVFALGQTAAKGEGTESAGLKKKEEGKDDGDEPVAKVDAPAAAATAPNKNGLEDQEEEEDNEEDGVSEDEEYEDGEVRLWPTRKSRARWIQAVRASRTLSSLALAMTTLKERCDSMGVVYEDDRVEGGDEEETDDELQGGFRVTRMSSRKEEKLQKQQQQQPKQQLKLRSRKERAVHKKANESKHDDVDDAMMSDEDWDEVGGKKVLKDGKSRHPSSSNSRGKIVEDPWDTMCTVCGKGGELICCDGCPKAFHAGCIGLRDLPEKDWFCDDCAEQTCGKCGKGHIKLLAHVICGSEDGSQGCDKVFHLKCAGLRKVPVNDWFCKKCSKN